MWQKSVRLLDYNAGAGLSDFVRQKLEDILKNEGFAFANPSSRHRLGQKSGQQILLASDQVARSIGASPDEILFVSSGTEANQSVIRSFASSTFGASDGPSSFGASDRASSSSSTRTSGIIIGTAEHSATYDLIPELREQFAFVHELPLLGSGRYDLQLLQNALASAKESGFERILVSLFWANNETGVVSDLTELKRVIDQSPVKVVLHLDGAQAWGKLPVHVATTPAQYITFSSHKIGAPAGTGVIWIRKGQPFHPLFPGTQGAGRRGGTENLLGILATGFAAEALLRDQSPEKFAEHTRPIRDHFESELERLQLPVLFWGRDAERVSNTSRFSFLNFQSYENWVELLDLRGFAVSHGSACKSQVIGPSRVLLAMGASADEALNSIRVSFGWGSTVQDATDCAQALNEIYQRKSTTGKAQAEVEWGKTP